MKEYFGGCHCGAIKFKFSSEESIEIWKCNCSICKMSDYEHFFINHKDFKIIKGNNQLSEYSFGTKQAKHLFCMSCGMKSFYQPRSHPDSYSVNLKCVDNPPKVMNIVNFDGENEYK